MRGRRREKGTRRWKAFGVRPFWRLQGKKRQHYMLITPPATASLGHDNFGAQTTGAMQAVVRCGLKTNHVVVLLR